MTYKTMNSLEEQTVHLKLTDANDTIILIFLLPVAK